MIGGGFSRGNLPAHWHNLDTATNGPMPPLESFNGAIAWFSADAAIYVPVVVPSIVVVKKLWYGNMTDATGNYDIGLYDAAGVALLRKGSAAKSATQGEIVWDCTDTTIGPGVYYMALACSEASDTFYQYSTTAPIPAALGVLTEAAALALPATATFAVNQTLSVVPLMGMYLDTRVS